MRYSVMREDYVEEHKVKCELCSELAYATWYDINWTNHDFCKSHLESIEEDTDYLQSLRDAYEEEAKSIDPEDPWFNDYEFEDKEIK